MDNRLNWIDFQTCGAPTIACPVCGMNYTHIQGVYTRMGRDATEASKPYPGTKPLADGVDGGERQSALAIVFQCESGHRFRLVIQHHKGNDFIGTEIEAEKRDLGAWELSASRIGKFWRPEDHEAVENAIKQALGTGDLQLFGRDPDSDGGCF